MTRPPERRPASGAFAETVEIGRVRGAAPGPTLVLVGGMHGNEPAGVEACGRLLARLRAGPALRAGEVVAFEGNGPALAAGRRYLQRDLNRQWTPARRGDASRAGATGRAGTADADPESTALARLAGALDEALARARGPVFALDLHTSSAEGVPFAIVGATEEDRAFAAGCALTGVSGLLDTLEGTLTRYLGTRGCVALAVEGGQHRSPAAASNLEAVATLGLCAAGLFAPAEIPGAGAARELLARARSDLPSLIEVVLRHPVRPGSDFRMEPGFINIQRTSKGALLAREDGAEIRAPFDGFVLLPLYQPQGEDGFFYGRELGR